MIAKADKGRTMLIIHKEMLKQKIYTFTQDNQIIPLDKDPMYSSQKHIQQTIQKCNIIIEKKPTQTSYTNKTNSTQTQYLDSKT
jgi:hypothetical protein